MDIDPADSDWWRRAVFYQIYPRSYHDLSGGGTGDLRGITSRLGYLCELGIDAIWISPMFPSPMHDFGYDVSNYVDVDPMFGSLADMDDLIAEAHACGIRVLLDWVPNHCSDQHPWFQESRSSRTNAKRDWFYWRDPKRDGSTPNNWRAVFGGPAWELDSLTGQYYLHSFLKEQPDLNWRNPDVVEAMYDTLRFWMQRGIDGFRIDVIHMILKHPEMPDNPPNPAWHPGMRDAHRYLWKYNSNYEDVFPAVAGIREVIDEFPGRVTVGETSSSSNQVAAYYGPEGKTGVHLAFNFHFIGQDGGKTPWRAEVFDRILLRDEEQLPAFAQPCFAFGNHDRSRIASRLNHDGGGQARARAAALLLLGLRGTPFIYYGEEIGMEDVDVPADQLQDPARFFWEGRDPERTPMQWDGSKTRGFSADPPWLPYGDPTINVADQKGDPTSMYELYRHAIATRKAEPSLHSGNYLRLGPKHGVFSFLRCFDGERPVLVTVNTSRARRKVTLPFQAGEVLACTSRECEGPVDGRTFVLPALGAAWIAQR